SVRPARGARDRDRGRDRGALPARAAEGARPQARRPPGRDGRRVHRGHGRAVTLAYVALGAHLGAREASIRRAGGLIGAQRLSAIIETPPWGVTDQPDFLNAVAEVETDLGPRPFLERLLEVERELGRVRGGRRFGPRTIDLDLLVYG